MFHRQTAHAFKPRHAPISASGRWYVSDAEYHEAIRRGMQLRSEVAAIFFNALGRKIAGLFKV